METVGKITAVLDDAFLLVESSEGLLQGQELTVFGTVEDPRLLPVCPTGRIDYPKGEIRVVYPQGGDIYLAKRFREHTERTRTITTPSSSLGAFFKLQEALTGGTKEVVERIPGPWSAELDLEKRLGICLPMAITVGDAVGRGTL